MKDHPRATWQELAVYAATAKRLKETLDKGQDLMTSDIGWLHVITGYGTAGDIKSARFMCNEILDKYGLHLVTARLTR